MMIYMNYMNLDDFFIKMIDKALQSVLSSQKNKLHLSDCTN